MSENQKEQERGSLAHKVFTALQQLRANAFHHYLEIGSLLQIVKDRCLYRDLDYPSFTAFLGSPEVAIKRSSAYRMIRQKQFFIDELQRDPDELAQIGASKLQVVTPVIEKGGDPEEWLGKAQALSRSDLIHEAKVALGKEDTYTTRTCQPDDERRGQMDYPTYRQFVKDSPCCACGASSPSDPHHFPRTKGAGGPDDNVIPLCRKCHDQYGYDPQKFLWENKDRIFAFFYRIAHEAYGFMRDKTLTAFAKVEEINEADRG